MQWPFTVRQAGGILDLVGPDGSALTTTGAYWFAWHAAFPAGDLITNQINPVGFDIEFLLHRQ